MSLFIVTGASSGIGRATACELARRRHKVVAVARNLDRLRSLGQTNADYLQIVAADLATTAGISAVGKALGSARTIDGIVHAAGSAVPLADYQDLDGHELTRHFSVHVAAPVALNFSLKSRLDGARLLYVDSYSAQTPRVGWAAYSIVKSAAQMSARAAAAELKNSAIIRVFPGGVRTPLVEAVLAATSPNETAESFRAMDCAGNIVEADVVGKYLADILLLASEDDLGARDSWHYNRPADRIF